ncbi:hypothetical protein ANTQUA_LOCUS10571 [Anthophora quadrimaculata]
MCFRHVLCIEAFANQGSTTVAYSTWDYSPNNTTQVFSVVKILRIELRLFCVSRTVVVARFASGTSFRLEAFENQGSTTVAYSTWDYSPNNTTQVFSVVKILRIELRLFCVSRTVVVARFASGTSFRLEAFKNQNSTTVAYSTWYCSRNTSIQVFSIVIVPRMELRLFYLSRTQVVVRCASDTCFRLEAFENQNSTTVAYSTWYNSRNTALQNRGCSEMCFRHVLCIEAFANQGSTNVAYSTWDYSPNNTTQVFSVVKILRIELRLFCVSRTVVVARFASGTSFRLEAFENQNSTTVAHST